MSWHIPEGQTDWTPWAVLVNIVIVTGRRTNSPGQARGHLYRNGIKSIIMRKTTAIVLSKALWDHFIKISLGKFYVDGEERFNHVRILGFELQKVET